MWTDLRFRSTELLELKRLDDLTPEQKEAFRELEQDAEFYGLLIPRPGVTLGVKSVTAQTAELFRELAAPRVLGPAVLGDDESRDDVVDMVLDGVLEIERGDAFVSGADAFPVFYPQPPVLPADGAIARLSREALEHAEDLETADPQTLTNALYAYNRIPITRFWRARFPDRDGTLAHLGADGGQLKSVLERYWTMSPVDETTFWISWRSKTPSRRQSRDQATYKLYVSPRPEHVRDAFHALVRVLADMPGSQFKIGPDANGLLRPDKIVAYFPTREELDVALAALHAELAGCPAHGIPFTAGIGDDGLLSWGIDPPDSERALSWLQRDSWRLWIAKNLGAAMSIAKRATTDAVEPWRFAVERVRRRGVDVETWTPTTIWRSAE